MPSTKTKPDRRSLILGEAARLFREKGFGGSSMRELAERVGMEAASMYNHIRSKDEILDAICFEAGEKYNRQLEEARVQFAGDYPRMMEAIIAFHVAIIFEYRDAVSVLNNDWKYLKPERLTEFKKMRKEYEKNLAGIITEGIAAGAFKEVNISVALFTLLSSLRWVELWYKPGRGVSKDSLAKDISAILMNGIKA
ncbi:TetR/AcrR family transcriptional regulator [Rurimicrobium arvi]|uniref:TetR/AcrR family transcriptional regulator n=1 Tax=Rurimicrobium arvi TaxID=2049916 RepID=A0ABP8N3Z5_9BACT